MNSKQASWAREQMLGLLALLMIMLLLPNLTEASLDELRPSLILGESIHLTLRSDQTHAEFERLDLEPLEQAFHIQARYVAGDRIRLTLTPYQTGLIQTPALRSGTLRLPAQYLEVIENPDIRLVWSDAPEQRWLGDWWSQRLLIELIDTGLSLNLDVPDGAELEVADLQRVSHQQASLDWAQRLDTPGLVTRQAPSLRVTRRQGGVWQFFAPPQAVRVSTRPSYIPPSLPSGPIEWHWQRPRYLVSGRVYEITSHWTAIDQGYLPPLTQLMQQQLTQQDEVEWLFQRHTTEISWAESGRKLTHIWQQPFRLEGIRWGYYAPIQWLYFDRHTQQLTEKMLPPQFFIALPIWLWLFIALLGLIAGLLILAALVWLIARGYSHVRLWFIMRQPIHSPQQAQDCWQALLQWSQAQKFGRPATQQAWLTAYQQRFGKLCRYQQAILALRPRLYAPQADE